MHLTSHSLQEFLSDFHILETIEQEDLLEIVEKKLLTIVDLLCHDISILLSVARNLQLVHGFDMLYDCDSFFIVLHDDVISHW